MRRPDRCASHSLAMKQVELLAGKVARTDSIVLVTGESGTGKGMLARAIHQQSQRAGQPFVPVNCGAIPANLLESEFFGHTRGAFTGADRARKGLFVEADGGTIFLDEIGELPLELQVKLLHVLEAREIRALGSEAVRKVDVRIVAASNRDLQQMVAAGSFRQDLYFRISGFHIGVPPLRERREDIPALIRHLLASGRDRFGVACELTLDPRAEDILIGHDWPGNVRELENVLQRAAILCEGGRITASDLPPQLVLASGAAAAPSSTSRAVLREQLRDFEHRLILRAIDECGGDRRSAARQLGIGLSSLYRKLDEYAQGRALLAG